MIKTLALDASTITRWQSCRRQFLLHADYTILRPRPKHLFDACLRKAILSLSAGASPEQASADARARFMLTAAQPGLDLPYGAHPYTIAKEWCAMLDTVLHALARLTLLTVQLVPPIQLNSRVAWQPLAHADDTGTLHSWLTVSRWDDAALAREIHGWHVFGDMAMCRAPLTLHVIVIGRERDGRRSSPWTRAWQHPGLGNLPMRFVRKDGSELAGWKPVYAAEHPEIGAAAWAEQLWREGVVESLVRHVPVAAPPDHICADTQVQVLREAIRMREALLERASTPWHAQPMSRGACDPVFGPCVWQPVCHSAQVADPATIGLYAERTRDTVTV